MITTLNSMSASDSTRKKSYPGVLVQCESGRFLAYYDHRTDIMASGENEKDAKKNLKEMYKAVINYETEKGIVGGKEDLPPNAKTRRFVENF